LLLLFECGVYKYDHQLNLLFTCGGYIDAEVSRAVFAALVAFTLRPWRLN
jgi:hypothetical protein